MYKYVKKLTTLREEGFFDKLILGMERTKALEDVTNIPIDKIGNEYYFFHKEQDCYIRISFGVGGNRMIKFAQEKEKSTLEMKKINEENKRLREERKKENNE